MPDVSEEPQCFSVAIPVSEMGFPVIQGNVACRRSGFYEHVHITQSGRKFAAAPRCRWISPLASTFASCRETKHVITEIMVRALRGLEYLPISFYLKLLATCVLYACRLRCFLFFLRYWHVNC